MFILFDSFFQDFHSESVYDRVEFDVLQMKRSSPANKKTISPHLPLKIGYCKSLSLGLDVHYLHNSPPIYVDKIYIEKWLHWSLVSLQLDPKFCKDVYVGCIISRRNAGFTEQGED